MAPKTIVLKGDPIRKERQAAEALTPGELLDVDASSKLIPHGNAGQNAAAIFCLEEDFVGDDIDTDYAADDTVQYGFFRQGDEVYAWLAAGENVADGDELESDGAGALQAHTPQAVDEGGTATYTIYANAIVARAIEDKDNSGGTTRVRVKVEIV